MADLNDRFLSPIDGITYLEDPAGFAALSANRDKSPSMVLGDVGLINGDSTGFVFLNAISGAPGSCVPTALTGAVAIIYDYLNNKLYFRIGSSWYPIYVPKLATLTYSSTISLDTLLASSFKTTTIAATNATINSVSAGSHGNIYTLIIVSDATGGDVITFGTNFKTTGTLTLTASKTYTMTFISDSLNLIEVSRTTGMT